ncbi:hypothetical protein BKA93DRAFT_764316 [Sparassis latifolia]|uniref:Rad60/SUMO-like domain-containing protein n=1 Tax=Sparassis crispa TaxID=139825 RepID=A0A401GLH3_9APHY|nr:hypothetical protein SCP_0500760 [Sparassis crispa]GBE83033.1 hypothetical protein SCP_0500760 [Sparassis crispa]
MSRPRPRPRPRPVVHVPAPAPAPTASSPGPSTITSPPLEGSPVDAVADEDELFFRNRTRTAQTWRKLDKISHEKEAHKRMSSDEEDEEDDMPHKHRRRTTKDEVPKWTKMSKDAILLLSSDDEDDEVILRRVEQATPNGKRDAAQAQKRVNKRQRSRSQSITPPPAVPLIAIQIAKEKVQQLIGVAPRAPSPISVEDDSTDTIALDPELASLARQMQARSQSAMDDDILAEGGPETVAIKVHWKPHPLNPTAKAGLWGFKMRRQDPFREVFDETADAAEIISDHLVMTYNGTRVFPSATPHSIGVWAEAELDACDKMTYEYLLANRRERSPSALHERSPSHARSPSPTLDESEADSAAESGTEDDKFRLTVRSTKAKDIVLTVRPTTACGAIVKAFLKKAGLAEQYGAAGTPAKKGKRGKPAPPAGAYLVVDGDRMDPASGIGEADLDDGDLVEVAGL